MILFRETSATRGDARTRLARYLKFL